MSNKILLKDLRLHDKFSFASNEILEVVEQETAHPDNCTFEFLGSVPDGYVLLNQDACVDFTAVLQMGEREVILINNKS